MTKGVRIKPTKEQLEHYIHVQKMKIPEIAELLGYKNGKYNLYRYCREYGIKFDHTPNVELRKIPFTDKQKSFCYGTMMGDGYLRKSKQGNHALVSTHSIKQVDYLNWKRTILQNFIVTDYNSSREHQAFNTTTTLLSFNTIIHPFLNELAKEFYKGGSKKVTQSILDNIDDFALAVWFMDDGSQNKSSGAMSISTNGFSLEENEMIQQWFMDKWSIETKIDRLKQRSGKITYATRINRSQAPKLVEIIKPHVIDSMAYKIAFNYSK